MRVAYTPGPVYTYIVHRATSFTLLRIFECVCVCVKWRLTKQTAVRLSICRDSCFDSAIVQTHASY